MSGLVCQKIRSVDISLALAGLSDTQFVDSGGTNGWTARPEWLQKFAEGLNLGGTIIYVWCRKLPAYQGIPPHVDISGHRADTGRRFHIPIVTHPDVTMRWPDDGVEEHMEAGYVYEINYLKKHEIVHKANADRIHVVVNVKDSTERAYV